MQFNCLNPLTCDPVMETLTLWSLSPAAKPRPLPPANHVRGLGRGFLTATQNKLP